MTPEPERRSAPGSPPTSDVQLLLAVAAGDEPAFAELRERYGPAVRRVCRTAGSEREDYEQEVFARIWRKASLFDPERGSPAAWLLTVARRTVLTQQGGRRPPQPVEEIDAVDPQPQPDVESFWLQSALARLPEREREVIVLAYYRDQTEREIARRLEVPLGTVKTWKRRGLNQLAALLGEEAP